MRRSPSFGEMVLVYAACCAVALLLWPYIQAAFGPDTTPYSNPEPYDRARAQRGGCSQYHPTHCGQGGR